MKLNRLYYFFIFVIWAATPLAVHASAVVWNVFYGNIEEHGLNGETHYVVKRDVGGGTMSPHLALDIVAPYDSGTLNFSPYDGFSSSMWIVALAGELVTSESIMQSSEFLFKNAPYGQSISDYSLAISSDHPAYIVFYDEFFVEDIANMEFTPTIGWVELYNDNGTIAVGNSAYMLAGGSLYVGGGEVIPEPSSGMLILFGAALLALKRRQMKTLNPVNPVNTVSKTKT